MKEILILPPGPFSKRDYERFGVNLLKKNFSVKILDLTAWIYPEFWKKYSDDVYKCKEYESISSKEDFLKHYLKINAPIVLDSLNQNQEADWIRKKIKEKKGIFVITDTNLIPSTKENITIKLKKLLKLTFAPIKLYKIFSNLIKQKQQPDILISGGLRRSRNLNAIKIIEGHHMDYDIYLNLFKNPNKGNDSYAVFLDEDMVAHPDYFQHNLEPPVNETQYYPALVNFLLKFQKKAGLKIKFAVHPKSKIKNLSNLLKGINYYRGSTAELVKESKLVLLHASTSLSYAILFKKPTLFLTSNDLNKSWIGTRISSFAKEIGSKVVNINSDLEKSFDLDSLFKINAAKYEKYKNNYLKHPSSPDIPLWEIFTKYIQSEKRDKKQF